MTARHIVYVVLLMTVFSGHAIGRPQPQEKSMSELTLNLSIRIKTIKSGDAIPAQINLTNKGLSDEKIPRNDGPTQFEYLLLDRTGSQTIRSISHRKKELSKARGLVPRAVIKQQTLSPNGTQIFTDDINELLIDPIPEGQYQLQALFRTDSKGLLRSNRVEIEIIENVK